MHPLPWPTNLSAAIVWYAYCIYLYSIYLSLAARMVQYLHLDLEIVNDAICAYIPVLTSSTSTNQRLRSSMPCRHNTHHNLLRRSATVVSVRGWEEIHRSLQLTICGVIPAPSPRLSCPLTPALACFRPWQQREPRATQPTERGISSLGRRAVWLAASVGFNIFPGPFSPSALWLPVMRYISN